MGGCLTCETSEFPDLVVAITGTKEIYKIEMMNVIFLFSGQARTSPFHKNASRRRLDILESYNKYIFTEEFINSCNYKIYISTDHINVEDAIAYFNIKNIGNIHLIQDNSQSDFYLKPVTQTVPNVESFLQSYNNKDFGKYARYDNSIYQHHKLLDCYNLFRHDWKENGMDTYVVRLRMDTSIKKNLMDILKMFTCTPKLEIVCSWDHMSVGKPGIMKCYCSGLENNYGNYTNTTIVSEDPKVWNDYRTMEMYQWMYAPERQLFEMLFEYCILNHLDINECMVPCNLCAIIR